MLFEKSRKLSERIKAWCLNPYSNGICSLSSNMCWHPEYRTGSLNPYSNGICSLSARVSKEKRGLGKS